MYLSKVIKIPLYETKVQFIVSPNIVKTVNNIYKHHNINTVWKDAPAGTMIGLGIDKYRIIINEEYLTYNTIIHELLHCVMALTADRQISEEEDRCWLMGYIGQEIFNFLNSKKVEIG